jgi:hypothetical protein
MFSDRQKLILITMVVLIMLFGGIGFYFFGGVIITKVRTIKFQVERKYCENSFVFSDDKIKWALDREPIYLDKYISCKAAISEKYEDCDILTSSRDERLEKSVRLNCYKTVWYKKVFSRLVNEKAASISVIKYFDEYINKYASDNSEIKQVVSVQGVKTIDLLNGIIQQKGDSCPESGGESCRAMLERNEKYCQALTDKKEPCISGVQFMKALDSGDIEGCNDIQDSVGILPWTCRFVLNQNQDYCAKKEVIADFITQYCSYSQRN